MMMQKYNISLIQTNNESIKLNKRGTSFQRCPFVLPLNIRMPAISEWTHSKVNPIDYPSFLQQQLVEVLVVDICDV